MGAILTKLQRAKTYITNLFSYICNIPLPYANNPIKLNVDIFSSHQKPFDFTGLYMDGIIDVFYPDGWFIVTFTTTLSGVETTFQKLVHMLNEPEPELLTSLERTKNRITFFIKEDKGFAFTGQLHPKCMSNNKPYIQLNDFAKTHNHTVNLDIVHKSMQTAKVGTVLVNSESQTELHAGGSSLVSPTQVEIQHAVSFEDEYYRVEQ